MAKKKSTSKAKRTTTARKSVQKSARKKPAGVKTTRKKSVKKARKVTKKKTAARRKPAVKPAARKKVRKPTVRKAAPREKASATAKPDASALPVKKIAKPKRPRRTKQAALPTLAPLPRPVHELVPTTSPPLITPPPEEPPPPPKLPAVGEIAPDFALPDEQGRIHTLEQYRGRRVVLYFYPRDNTPGCTTEACGFRDTMASFSDRDVIVLGVSPDSVTSHDRFAQQHGLNFPLLADPDHVVAERYGVWVPKSNYGRTYMGIARTTFIIDEDGRIAHVFENVKAAGHEQEVLAWLSH